MSLHKFWNVEFPSNFPTGKGKAHTNFSISWNFQFLYTGCYLFFILLGILNQGVWNNSSTFLFIFISVYLHTGNTSLHPHLKKRWVPWKFDPCTQRHPSIVIAFFRHPTPMTGTNHCHFLLRPSNKSTTTEERSGRQNAIASRTVRRYKRAGSRIGRQSAVGGRSRKGVTVSLSASFHSFQ